MDTLKSTHSEDVPFKIVKDNADMFANFVLQNFNKCIIDGRFSDQLKKADVSPVFKKEKQLLIGVSYHLFQKFMSVSFITR